MASIPDGPHAVAVAVDDEDELSRLAGRMAAALPERAFVTLEGDLGAGKTTLVKAIAAASGGDPCEVVSPTFGLIHVHEFPRGRIVHADFHRLASAAELRETGWEDAVATPPGCGCWVFVEWPGRIVESLPAARLDVAIAIDSERGRTLAFTARSPAYDSLVDSLRNWPRA